MMRQSLRELYGLQGGLSAPVSGVLETHAARRFRAVAVGLSDAGLDADRRALPWTVGLLFVSTCSPGCSAICWAALRATTATAALLQARRRRSRWASTRSPTTSSPSCC